MVGMSDTLFQKEKLAPEIEAISATKIRENA